MLQAFIITYMLTTILKLSVGRLRPDFLDRCEYNEITEKCDGNKNEIIEGRKSFPSGYLLLYFYIY